MIDLLSSTDANQQQDQQQRPFKDKKNGILAWISTYTTKKLQQIRGLGKTLRPQQNVQNWAVCEDIDINRQIICSQGGDTWALQRSQIHANQALQGAPSTLQASVPERAKERTNQVRLQRSIPSGLNWWYGEQKTTKTLQERVPVIPKEP